MTEQDTKLLEALCDVLNERDDGYYYRPTSEVPTPPSPEDEAGEGDDAA
jgi:hypothetical protein